MEKQIDTGFGNAGVTVEAGGEKQSDWCRFMKEWRQEIGTILDYRSKHDHWPTHGIDPSPT